MKLFEKSCKISVVYMLNMLHVVASMRHLTVALRVHVVLN